MLTLDTKRILLLTITDATGVAKIYNWNDKDGEIYTNNKVLVVAEFKGATGKSQKCIKIYPNLDTAIAACEKMRIAVSKKQNVLVRWCSKLFHREAESRPAPKPTPENKPKPAAETAAREAPTVAVQAPVVELPALPLEDKIAFNQQKKREQIQVHMSL